MARSAATGVWGLVLLLILLHQDFWFRDRVEPLVFGFLPVGLAYHMALSLGAAGVWALANHFCFPEETAAEVEQERSGEESG